jgi:RNA polymerase sigma factor (TIGR02999 family)
MVQQVRWKMSECEDRGSNPIATDALFAEVYDRLKGMASRRRGANGNPTLSTTEIVHELYLRMEGAGSREFEHSMQFFAYAARAMRSILVDLARKKQQQKKGGGQVHLPLDAAAESVEVDSALALALDTGLRALEVDDPRAARVVELHFFAGLDLDRISELIGVARRTIDRDWRYARAFLTTYADEG